jgi:cytochrome o ubiquinol oxidase subunit IV
LAGGLTATSFYVAGGQFLYGPGVPAALIALAVGQMGVHLIFFLHITTGPESTNNVLALAFGVLIVFLLIAGTLFIMTNLNHHMPSMNVVMSMQR